MTDNRAENATTEETAPVSKKIAVAVDLGDVVTLTEGQGGGSAEDKRRAYNC
ncbi:albusnodin family lasso peptide [Streptomyces sp. ZAF1911]|uniref:albusnodin family lasso peptide n=1 Tax=Streptomyces sp. ZAF1911 TaxID=2944129 RepID=UPI00237AA034|nr:albusnodin family lasso peptide [Streptomyces sp. ZAF1911]MDD9376512.1 albusnodin family lasso peptide [Streptomyces sp. ZAF1911]